MVWLLIILIVLAIWFLPSLIMVLAGFYVIFEEVFIAGFTDPTFWIITFSLIAGIWFLGAWGKAGMPNKGKRKNPKATNQHDS